MIEIFKKLIEKSISFMHKRLWFTVFVETLFFLILKGKYAPNYEGVIVNGMILIASIYLGAQSVTDHKQIKAGG